MARKGWHMLTEESGVTVTRLRPVRWDVAAECRLPSARPARIAHQVRQDIWRALRGQRGFAPAVAVSRDGSSLWVRAGGRVEARFDRARLEAALAQVLADPARRKRWVAHAREDLIREREAER